MELKKVVSMFNGKNIAVVGDIMMDEFIYGNVSRISPEAPVPILDFTSKYVILGGAANAANNLNSLGANVHIAGIVGNDEIGENLVKELKGNGIDVAGIITDEQRPTTLKTRIIAQNQHIVRIDKESREDIETEMTKKLLIYLEKIAPSIDIFLVSDYSKGVVTFDLMEGISRLCKKYNKQIVVDSNMKNLLKYNGITVFISNQQNASKALGIPVINETSLRNMGNKLLSKMGCEAVLIINMDKGVSLFEKTGRVTHLPPAMQCQFDITGVGDTVASIMALCISAGTDLIKAAKIANYGASIVGGKPGTAVISRRELESFLND